VSDQRERDLVLNPNEYAYVLDKTKGLISCVVGSYKMSLSTSDALVVFNERTKRFEEANFQDAITTFVSAPENWYVTLKNPAKDNAHPTTGTSNQLPDLQIGKKVNIKGNVSFALYPGQMAKVIQGHRLHSNQYLLARVYDADVLPKSEDGNEYSVGQLLVIKGTEVPFYIPPTGIEVLPVERKENMYVRDAVTLERLEYCILKDEQGNKKYIHGPAVVFPEPDEVFVESSKGNYIFKAIELSEISGIYVKVIADYKDDGKEYKAGDELFITGKDQMIYYPRPEHAIIDYEGKVIHHAIAIPVGEGRYVLDRKTGNIKTVKGAKMYLPDPRNEVIVRRKLTKKQCELWYPGNNEVLKYNTGIDNTQLYYCDSSVSRSVPSMSLTSLSCNVSMDALENGFIGQENAIVNEGFSRGNTYSKPRTITIDNKYDGVVSIDIWTGYAVNVVSKNGNRKVVLGPQTYLMDYDETLEVLELSTGKPKTTDHLFKTVFLRVENNKISDIIKVQTKDFVEVQVKVSYCVDFLPEYQDKWFNVENYVKYMTDRQRSLMKREAKKYTIEEFYENASEIIRNVALNIDSENTREESESSHGTGRLFKENGMFVRDVEVLSVHVEEDVEDMINDHYQTMMEKTLELSNVNKEIEVIKQLTEAEKTKADLKNQSDMYKLELKNRYEKESIEKREAIRRMEEQAEIDKKTAEKNLQELKDTIQKAELAREKEKNDLELARKKEIDNLSITKQKAYTDAIKKVIESISPDLIASMTSQSNAELLKSVSESISPYAMASGESVAEFTNKLLRGTSLEGLLSKVVSE
jgi:major vault protein